MMQFELEGQNKKGRSQGTCRKEMEEESVNVGWSWEDALCGSKWIVGVNRIATGLR